MTYPASWFCKFSKVDSNLQELDASTKQELESTLKKFAKKNENAFIKYKVDPSIIGGLVVSIGDRYVDMSTASKVKKYSEILKSVA